MVQKKRPGDRDALPPNRGWPLQDLEDMFSRRGLEVFRKNPSEGLFFPPDCSQEIKDSLYVMLKRYSFRLLLRDLIHAKEGARPEELTRYCSEASAARYLKRLEKLEIIQTGPGGRCVFRRPAPPSFGESLEWFIAEAFKREFGCEAIFGVSFKGSRSGGDYDVIALVEGNLAYVEVKSSPPKGIDQKEVNSFFLRMEDLLPHVAFFFVDTELRMKDKIVPMFEAGIRELYGPKRQRMFSVERLHYELFHLDHRIFILNSKRGIIHNFTICLRDFFRTTQSSLKALFL